VVAADQITARPQVTIFGSADEELLARNCDFLAGVLPFHDLQLQLHIPRSSALAILE
jgi:hypothetical protein